MDIYNVLDITFFCSYSYSDHVYSIAERVEGEGSTLTCPECLAGINNQTTRSQPEVN